MDTHKLRREYGDKNMERVNECGHPERKHLARGRCRSCYDAHRYADDPEYAKEKARKRRVANPEYSIKYARKWRADNPECKAEQDRKWRANNLERAAETKSKYTKKRMATDPNFRMVVKLRKRIGNAIKRGQKAGSAVADLGCSIPEFRAYLETMFQSGMTWENHGEWHIDHIIPLISFDLTDREQFLRAAHFSNQQPLWAKQNLKKGASVFEQDRA